MKFVHIADMHFDCPFINLADKDGLGDIRRLEQRQVFKKVIEYIKENNIELLLISGDLYEHQYVKKSTIEYINQLFKEIPNTRIFISPGNHDPYLKNSYYNKFLWSENVKIFTSKIEKVELEDVNIYGFGFDNFYCRDVDIESIELNNKNKFNFLVIHGTLDGANLDDREYNSMSKKMLKEKGFDYVALGHIHKLDYNQEENQNIVYPGSTVSLGFDELGKHGMIVGNIDEKGLKLEFVPLDEREFKLQEIDVTELQSKEDLIEKINELEFLDKELIEIILVGKRNFEIDKYELYKLISNDKIIKIKNKTKVNYNLNELSNNTTLKGLFAMEMLNKLENPNLTEEQKEIIENAIEIGMEALN